mgnify:CR=1 FL=1
MEEASREDSMAKIFVASTANAENSLPKRTFCPVTGLAAPCTDSKSDISLLGFRALEQMRERQQAWTATPKL